MIYSLAKEQWNPICNTAEKNQAIEAIETGHVIHLPTLPFNLTEQEKIFLSPHCHQGNSKNISFDPKSGRLKGTMLKGQKQIQLAHMLFRFMKHARMLLEAAIPEYQPHLITGRTSFRPIEILGRKSSKRQDDTRVHVDAFTATPNQGKRILRVFSNINPEGQPRHWQLGETFETLVQKFSHTLRPPLYASRKLLNWLKITKSYRTLYDHYMLALHDNMKLNDNYQNTLAKKDVHFAPNTSWIVMTDHVSHAALSGQYLLEQTFYLPVSGMKFPELSPLKILEKHFKRTLI